MLEADPDFTKVSIDGPGFINLSLSDAFIGKVMDEIAADERYGVGKVANPHTVVLDFGGPNVAKAPACGAFAFGRYRRIFPQNRKLCRQQNDF